MEKVGPNQHTNKTKSFDNSDYNISSRSDSQEGHGSSLKKFLKRKPDHKKILQGVQSKKRRQNSSSEYFILHEKSNKKANSRYITNKHESIEDSKIKYEEGSLLLESVKSQDNIFSRRNEIGLLVSKNQQERNKINKEQILSKQSNSQIKNIDQELNLITKVHDINLFSPHQRISSKKSRTEYFNFDQLKGLSGQISDSSNKNDANELNSTQENGDMNQQYQKLRQQFRSLTRKLKLLEKQVELCTERNYLITTQKKHLEEMLKEKDKIIDRMHRERSLFNLKGKSNVDKDIQKYKEELKESQKIILQQKETNKILQEEVNSIQNQLNVKSEELILVYDQYTDLQSKYRKQQQTFNNKLEQMKSQIDKIRLQHQPKGEYLDYSQLNQTAKFRQKIFRQQQQIKYLQIQNQCLLISKDQLCKSQSQNRKLRDQRDYFKMRIMQNIKRTKKHPKDFSRSDNASIVLELSDPSIDHY